jgi:hypothetical protein
MYCSGCGQPISPNQPACPQCGKPAVQAAGYAAAGFVPYNRVQRHIQVLAIFWLVYSLLALVAFLVFIPFMSHFFGHAIHGFDGHDNFPFPMAMHWIVPFITILVYLRAALGAMVGIGLLRRERWARPLAMVVAVLTLLKLPFGTALGIYTLWVLVPALSAQEFDMLAAS